jgi:D-3-phosphoglycerate dehydrogenase
MNFKVVMIIDVPGMKDYTNILKNMGVEFIRKDCKSEKEIHEIAHDADFIITISRLCPVPRRVIEQLEKCKFIETTGIGYDGIDVETATEQAICVINNPDYCIEEVSDHAMALILRCSRKIAKLNYIVKEGGMVTSSKIAILQEWSNMGTLRNKTLGLIGLDRIGRLVARKAKGFDMRIIGYDPYLDHKVAEELGVELVGLDQLFHESDFISIHEKPTLDTPCGSTGFFTVN